MNNGWRKVGKTRGHRGVYDKYGDRVVVIVPPETKPTHIALTKAGMDVLGNPERIDLFERGSNVGVMGSADGYKPSNHRSKTGSSLFYISVRTWLMRKRLKVGVYEAHLEDGMIVFDCEQSPASLR